MDKIDRKILEYLRENGRAAYTDIAESAGVSEGTVRNRVDRMLDDGVIERFTVETSDTGVAAVVMIEVSTDRDIAGLVEEFPGDIEVDEVTGEYDLVARVSRETTEDLNDEIDRIRGVDGVESTTTFSVLKSHGL
ncbi:MAG: Lrp/AsnC family transcriptional regulator [Candidatus Nanohaloarchaea archaeon]